jgi:hypothetical protein
MEDFFKNLDSIGFKSIEKIEPLTPSHDKEETRRSLNSSLPKEYLEVINKLSNEKRKDILLKLASSIHLFLKTKFNETGIFQQWADLGTIPHYYHKGLNTKNTSLLAGKIVRIRKKIDSDRDRISKLESLDKNTKQQTMSLEKAYTRRNRNREILKELENEFYFEFVDFESSLGGIY